MANFFYVFLGGGLGSLMRFGISRLIQSRFDQINPMATLMSNILSSVILALFLITYTSKFTLTDGMKFFIVVGFCGGFSTFSTCSYETFELLKMGHHLWAFLNAVVSVLICVALIFLVHKWTY